MSAEHADDRFDEETPRAVAEAARAGLFVLALGTLFYTLSYFALRLLPAAERGPFPFLPAFAFVTGAGGSARLPVLEEGAALALRAAYARRPRHRAEIMKIISRFSSHPSRSIEAARAILLAFERRILWPRAPRARGLWNGPNRAGKQ
jgi:hypothetical protein